jgi:hypothetical protein
VTDKPAPIFEGLISESFEPGPFEPIETWEHWLAEVQAMPDSALKEYALDNAKWTIAMKRHAIRARRHGVEWLH